MATTNVYVLELVEGKYYVGTSKNVLLRYQQHVSGNGGAVWTKKYPPIRIVEVLEKVDEFEENNMTKKYMATFGIDNVRGGAYCTIVLPAEVVAVLTKEIRSSQGCCVRCGRKGHFVTNCYANTTVDGTSLTTTDVKSACTRCGRNTHKADVCTNKTHVDGGRLEVQPCTRCGRITHGAKVCTNKTHANGTRLDNEPPKPEPRPEPKYEVIKDNVILYCMRCNRNNHNSDKCYAKTTSAGLPLDNTTNNITTNNNTSSNATNNNTNNNTKDDSCVIS